MLPPRNNNEHASSADDGLIDDDNGVPESVCVSKTTSRAFYRPTNVNRKTYLQVKPVQGGGPPGWMAAPLNSKPAPPLPPTVVVLYLCTQSC